MDAARVARRLGAEDAVIVYRRTREQMPAHQEEAEDAEREGVRINWLRTDHRVRRPRIAGRGTWNSTSRVTHGRPGDSRRWPPTR